MDDKTEQLRDIFMEVSDEGTVTESQAETRGSLATDEDDESVAEQLRRVVAELREAESFDTDFETGTYVRLVQAFYDDAADEALAEDLDLTREEVFRARMDLHLLREADADAPFDLAELRRRTEASDEALAAAFDVDEATVRQYRRVVAAEDAARVANHRYRTEFEELLTDVALAGEYAEGLREDGLDEAAEDIETDVSF
jgi:hypothetical protein